MLDTHDHAVLGTGGHGQLGGQGLLVGVQGVVAPGGEGLRQAGQDRAAVAGQADRRRLAVGRDRGLAEGAAEVLHDALEAQADAEDRDLPVQRQPDGTVQAEVLGPARAG